jgi:LysR family transcriptional regulator (chromosome initiation inhibitor)
MLLDHQHLAAFQAVIDEGSFEAAARVLHISRGAVSQRIRLLEERIGQVLIRRAQPCTPTQAGQALARMARQVQLLHGETLRELGRWPADARSQIAIAVNADSLATWFLAALAPAAQSAGVVFDVRVDDQDHTAALLRDGTVLAAVTAQPVPVQGCRVEKLGAMRYLAVCSQAFKRQWFTGGVNAQTLAVAPHLVFNRKDALQAAFIRQLLERDKRRFAGALPKPPAHYIPASAGFLEAAALGLGWGMVPETMAAEALQHGLVQELVPARYVDVPLHWQHWRLDSAALRALTAGVKAAAKKALR